MTAPNMSAEALAKPKLNTTDWVKPVDHSEEPQEVSPLSRTNSFTRLRGQDIDGSAVGSLSSSSSSQVGSSVSTSTAASQPHTHPSGLSPEDFEVLVKRIVKDTVTEVMKSGDVSSPLDTSRSFEANVAGSLLSSSSYPSPPSSVVCATTSSNPSSPQGGSPTLANATVATLSSVVSATKSSPANPQPKLSVRFRTRDLPAIHSIRPETAQTTSSAVEGSVVDRQWGVLVDEDGYPTRRLEQVLGGLANYMITEFSPSNSIVITPEKLSVFYTRFKLNSEIFPFEAIFSSDSRDLKKIGHLYEDLRLEYHLVQVGGKGEPHIPGLTPAGFVKWIKTNMLAYPDQEAKRLGIIVSELPLTADGILVDGKPERLPRQLSRRLLPLTYHKRPRGVLDEAIKDWSEDTVEPPPANTSSRARLGSVPEARAPPQSNTYSKRADDDRRQSVPVPLRDRYAKSYIDANGYRIETNSGRIPRANSDTGATLQRQSLPHPPIGRHQSTTRARSPPPKNRLTVSTTDLGQGNGFAPSSISSPGQYTPSSPYGSLTVPYTEFSGRDADRSYTYSARDSRPGFDEAPRSAASLVNYREKDPAASDRSANRRSLVVPGGPTWDDYYNGNTPTRGRTPTLDDGGY